MILEFNKNSKLVEKAQAYYLYLKVKEDFLNFEKEDFLKYLRFCGYEKDVNLDIKFNFKEDHFVEALYLKEWDALEAKLKRISDSTEVLLAFDTFDDTCPTLKERLLYCCILEYCRGKEDIDTKGFYVGSRFIFQKKEDFYVITAKML